MQKYENSNFSSSGPISSHLSLNELSEEIMSIWEERVRTEVTSAGDLLRPALRDAMPKFLDLLSEALSERYSRGLIEEASDLVKKHAGERARETTFGPSQVVQEFQMLRDTITTRLENEASLSEKDYQTIQKTFDQAIQEALMEFFLVHASLREQFMATLSHDLRNPIGVAKMGAELIQDIAREIEDSDIREDIIGVSSRIVANMKRADRMIQDLLDASALKIGEKLQVKIAKCDLLTVAHNVVTDFSDHEKHRIQIIGSSCIGYWDCDGLRRCLENLIKNAFKYGLAEAPITVRIVRVSDRVRLSVHNYGNPIQEHEQKAIFQAFGRTKSAQMGLRQGWGIGLALVRSVSESLGGNTYVESSKEGGTTFTIDLPDDSRGFMQIH